VLLALAALKASPTWSMPVLDQEDTSVLAAARAALGGSALEGVNSLCISGVARQSTGGKTLQSRQEMWIGLPDRYLALRTLAISGRDYQTARGVKGRELIEDRAARGPEDYKQALRRFHFLRTQREATRMMASLLLTDRTPVPVAYAYAGTAKSRDGGLADVLDVKLGDGFSARLFMDQKTHLPLMMTFDELLWPSGYSVVDSGFKLPEMKLSPHVMYLSEHRRAGRLMIPHLIVQTVNGEPTERFQVEEVTINPKDIDDEFRR
jgi:hypothetical protein